MKFIKGDIIEHHKGMLYKINVVPDDRRLECCDEPFYEYEDVRSGQEWIRRQDEMEDGRFTPVKINHE